MYDLSLPKRGLIKEDYVPDTYTEAELRQLVFTNGSFGHGVLNSAKIEALPDLYLTSLYEMVRYGKDPMPGIFRLKAGDTISSSMHALPGLLLMSRVLLGIYRKLSSRIEPDRLAEADRMLRLLTHVDYALWNVLRKYQTVNPFDIPLVFSAQYIMTTAGDGVAEETYFVYLDKDKLDEYLDGGGTTEEAVSWWVTNKTQPPALG
jgi:hypothetical protein